MAPAFFALASEQLGVSSSTVNAILLVAAFFAIGLPLFLVFTSQKGQTPLLERKIGL